MAKAEASQLLASLRNVLPASMARTTGLQLALRIAASAFFASIQTLYLSQGLSTYAPSTQSAASITIFAVLFVALFTVSRLFVVASFRARSFALAFIAACIALSLWHAPSTAVITVRGNIACQATSIEASPVREWGSSQLAFYLHPDYPGQPTTEEIAFPVPVGATTLNLVASKAKDSVLAADGSYLGDGVQIYVTTDASGEPVRALPPLTLSPSEVAKNGWTPVVIPIDLWDREVRVKVTKGPPGSTTYYDSTYVSLNFSGAGMHLAQLGGWSFGIITAAVLLLTVWGAQPGFEPSGWRQGASLPLRVLTHSGFVAFCAVVLCAAAIYQGLSQRLLFYDTIRYFLNAKSVAETLKSGGSFVGVLRDAAATNADEYTLWSTLAPGVVSVAVEPFNTMTYILALAVVYGIPAAIACSVMGYAMVRPVLPEGTNSTESRVNLIVVGCFAAFLLAPVYLAIFLIPFPDIGGVVLACGLILCLAALCQALLDPPAAADASWRSLVWRAVLVAFLAAALFLFRRWYVFLAIGVIGAAALWLAYESMRRRFQIPGFRSCLLLVVSIGLLAFLAIMAKVVVIWAATAEQRHYADLYSGYFAGYVAMTVDSIRILGIAAPIMAISICVLLIVRTRRALPFIILAGSLAGLLGMTMILTPGLHHYYILMPLISGSAAAAVMLLASRWGVRAASLSLLAAGLVAVGIVGLPFPLSLAVPRSTILKPPVRNDLPELKRLVEWLVKSVGPSERYCVVASSSVLNVTIVDSAWQLEPALRERIPKSIWLGEVDSRDGPPRQEFRNCNVVLVADPVQLHLPPTEQETVTLLAEAIQQARGVGAAFEREGTEFRLKDNVTLTPFRSVREITRVREITVTVTPFRRVREITDAEYQLLQEEFYKSKGERAELYRKRFGRKRDENGLLECSGPAAP